MKIKYTYSVLLVMLLFILSSLTGLMANTANSEKNGNPLYPGGLLTHSKTNGRHALMHINPYLSKMQGLDLMVGQSIFEKIWIPSPSATHASDGLGPLYNARACAHCHINNGRGRVPLRTDARAKPTSLVVRVGRAEVEANTSYRGDPVYGEQIQNFAITGYQAEADVHVDFEQIPVELEGGEIVFLHKPSLSLSNLQYGALADKTRLSLRVAPPLIGMGLLDAIDEQDILSYADPKDENGDGISGRANQVWDASVKKNRLGRFNYKASSPTLAHQSLAAFKNDVGISSYYFPSDSGDCTASQKDCLKAPGGSPMGKTGAEVQQPVTSLMVEYVRNLAVPGRRIKEPKQVQRGQQLFNQSGCISCHRASFTTAQNSNKAFSEQTIWPYSDLLLHDMGDGLADEVANGMATGREWRTQPLWGIGLNKIITGSETYLHDGRARSIREAILWHGGEAQQARNSFAKLAPKKRQQLIQFVKSL